MDIYVYIHIFLWFDVDIYPKYLFVIIAIRISIPINRYPYLEHPNDQDIHMLISKCCICISLRISKYIDIDIPKLKLDILR